jgi:uncharacterized protein
VRMRLDPSTPDSFPLFLRIPGWATETSIKVNGEFEQSPAPGSFARIERVWTSGDIVELMLPLKPRASRWFNDSIAIERGPLVFSYEIGEDWVKLRDRGMTADWQAYPRSQWNYAIGATPENAPYKISSRENSLGPQPFAAQFAPVELHLRARKLPAWRAEDGAADPVPRSPVTSDQPDEEIRLIPYAAAKLRITAFPQLQDE